MAKTTSLNTKNLEALGAAVERKSCGWDWPDFDLEDARIDVLDAPAMRRQQDGAVLSALSRQRICGPICQRAIMLGATPNGLDTRTGRQRVPGG
jgi:hypothetical protein